MKKILIYFLTLTMLLSGFTIGSHAEGAAVPTQAVDSSSEITPYWSNAYQCSTTFVISETGLAGVKVTYDGIAGVTTQVKSEVYIQKKVLGLFWTKVDIGVEDNVWVDISTEDTYAFSHSVQLEDTGTYRAVFTITFSGTGGEDDVVTEKMEKTY